MRRLLLCLILALPCHGQILDSIINAQSTAVAKTITYSTGCDNVAAGSGTVLTCTVNAPAGSLIVVGSRNSTSTTTATITDTAGDTFTEMTGPNSCSPNDGTRFDHLHYKLASAGNASNVVTQTLGAGRTNRFLVVEVFTYTGGSMVFDVCNKNDVASATTSSATNTYTPTDPTNSVGVALLGCASGLAVTADTGYTLAGTDGAFSCGTDFGAMEYNIGLSAGAQAAVFTMATNPGPMTTIGSVFKVQ